MGTKLYKRRFTYTCTTYTTPGIKKEFILLIEIYIYFLIAIWWIIMMYSIRHIYFCVTGQDANLCTNWKNGVIQLSLASYLFYFVIILKSQCHNQITITIIIYNKYNISYSLQTICDIYVAVGLFFFSFFILLYK